MKHLGSIRIQIVAVAALALLAVPVAQAKDIALRSFQASSGETAQGVRADGLRLQALARAYQSSGETARGLEADGLRMQAVANAYREQGAGATATTGSYSTALSVFVGQESASAAQPTTAQPVSPAPISENSPVELRLQPNPQPAQPVAHTSFNWGDAGIGAGIAAFATILAGLGAGGLVRRRGPAHA